MDVDKSTLRWPGQGLGLGQTPLPLADPTTVPFRPRLRPRPVLTIPGRLRSRPSEVRPHEVVDLILRQKTVPISLWQHPGVSDHKGERFFLYSKISCIKELAARLQDQIMTPLLLGTNSYERNKGHRDSNGAIGRYERGSWPY